MREIGAMVLYSDDRYYLEYCLESLKDCVDKIYIGIDVGISSDRDFVEELIEYMGLSNGQCKIIELPNENNFALKRNDILKDMTEEWVLMLDSDEVLAHLDGTPVSHRELEMMIEDNSDKDGFHLFTLHFMYNYRMIDGRKNGEHWSANRLFKREGSQFIKPIHEYLNWDVERMKKTAKVTTLAIYHFGHCKGMEKLREKYKFTMGILENPFRAQMDVLGCTTVDEYCSMHEIFRMTIPLKIYDGPLPKCLKLW